jgi:hypothetical protein
LPRSGFLDKVFPMRSPLSARLLLILALLFAWFNLPARAAVVWAMAIAGAAALLINARKAA